MDKNSADKLSKVHPVLSEKVAQLINNLAELGYEFRVVQGLRTYEEQNKLYNQPRDGKDNDGDGRIDEADEKVTNAKGGQSNHNFGLAADLCPFKNGKPQWNDSTAFKTLGKEAQKIGLEWGGNWKFVDMPHVQLYGLTVPQCRALYEQGGLNAVWSKMNQILKVSPASTTQGTPVLTPAVEAEQSAHVYTVKPGDTAGGICARFGIELKKLKELNNLNGAYEIKIGQKLRVK